MEKRGNGLVHAVPRKCSRPAGGLHCLCRMGEGPGRIAERRAESAGTDEPGGTAVSGTVGPAAPVGADAMRPTQTETQESVLPIMRAAEPGPVHALFQRLRRHTGIDFESYKRSAFERRLARRLAATHVSSVDAYLAHIEARPDELDKLRRELLISVTTFFRDRAAFESLARAVRQMLERAVDKEEIRVWVAGCATGEEAYSVAIVVLEAMREARVTKRLRVFATDVDSQALQAARRGTYPGAAMERVPAHCVERYFTVADGLARARPLLRDCVNFANHSVASDPPFLRSDIVCCRNVLIYFQPALQEKVMALLHFALETGGLLFLGRSEAVGPFESSFETVDRAAHLYRSRGPRRVSPLAREYVVRPEPVRKSRSPAEQIAEAHLQLMLARYVPATVLLTREGDVVHTMGEVAPYLSFPPGSPTLALVDLVRPELRMDVQILRRRALHEAGCIRGRIHALEPAGGLRMVMEAVSALGRDLLLLTFERVSPAPAEVAEGAPPEIRCTEEDELDALRENLHSAVEELEAQNEAMQALNEQLHMTNAELESAHEELQSTNEELNAVNDELERKSIEVSSVNEDVLSLLGSLAFPVVMLDDGLRVMHHNDAAKRMFGIRLQAEQPPPLLEWPTGFADVATCVERTQATGLPQEMRLTHGGRHYAVAASPCRLPSRDAVGVLLQMTDVTVLTQARDQLAVSEERVRAVLDNSSMATMIADVSGHIEYANPNFSALAGQPRDALLGKPFWSLFATEAQAWLKQHHVATLATGEAAESDDVLPQPSGTCHLHSMWIPVRRQDSRTVGVCWKALDTTVEHAARAALEESEALNRAVLTGMPAIMAVLDQEGRIVSVNDAWREFAARNGGRHADGWVGESYLSHCGSEEDSTREGALASAAIRDVLRGKRDMFELEYPCHSPDEERWFRMLVVPLRLASGGAVVLHVDVSPLHQAQESLARANSTLETTVEQRTRELRLALDELEMFTFTVSHDLRSPLRTLIGFSELVKEEAGERLEPQIKTHLERIKMGALRMNGYLDELLKLSHLTRGDLLVTPIDVTAMAREIGAEEARRAPDRHVEFVVADGLTLKADANLMRAVFENLIGNAWKYTRTRETARIQVGSMVRAGVEVIYVRDNGVGFDMLFREKLFMPFQRLHQAREFEGHGLGLAAAKRIVLRHGGTLEADARPDLGATFYLRVP